MKRLCAVLAKVKSEELFLRNFWLPHYTKYFTPLDLHVHAEKSSDGTEDLCRQWGVSLTEITPGTVQHGKNNLYVVEVIDKLLQDYECVLFAESPDDIIVPGPHTDLRNYIGDFVTSQDAYRFLTCYNVMHDMMKEPSYDREKGTLLSQRSSFIRCNQYDNAFLWKIRPTWGRGWHDLIGVNDGKRICGGGDTQGESKRLYNMHIHYADFDMCNARHKVRQSLYSPEERNNGLYSCQVDNDLKSLMNKMITTPDLQFSEGLIYTPEEWMKNII